MNLTHVRDLAIIAAATVVGFTAGVIAEDLIRGPRRSTQ